MNATKLKVKLRNRGSYEKYSFRSFSSVFGRVWNVS